MDVHNDGKDLYYYNMESVYIYILYEYILYMNTYIIYEYILYMNTYIIYEYIYYI